MQLPSTTPVSVARIVYENIPPRPSDCAIESLTAMPEQAYRELGTIDIPNADLNEQNIRAMIDQNACALGADAIVVNPPNAGSSSGAIEVLAIAYESNLAARMAQARSSGAVAAAGSSSPSPSPAPSAGPPPTPSP